MFALTLCLSASMASVEPVPLLGAGSNDVPRTTSAAALYNPAFFDHLIAQSQAKGLFDSAQAFEEEKLRLEVQQFHSRRMPQHLSNIRVSR